MGRLADAVAQMEAASYRPRCGIGVLAEGLRKAERAELAELLASPVQHTLAARAINEVHGASLRPGTIARHRQGVCACGSPE